MKIIVIIFFSLAINTSYCQTLDNYLDSVKIIRKDFIKPANWKEADKDRTGLYFAYPKSMNIDTVLSIIKKEKDFGKFIQAKKWCIDNYRIAVPHLIKLIVDTTKVGLINSGDVVIWGRVETGEMKFYGHGGLIFDDIFTIAGRCSYILHELTGENFARVNIHESKDRLVIYQEIWLNWFLQL